MTMLQKQVACFIGFIAVNNIIAFSFNLGMPYYLIMGMGFVFFLLKSKVTYVDVGMLCFYLACVFSIFVNKIPVFFHPWQRLSIFVLMTVLLSPFLGSPSLYRFRSQAFRTIQWLMQFVVVLSLLAFLAGISFSGRRDIAGITNQSMLLAPISASVILGSIYKLNSSTISRKMKYYFIVLFVCSFITLLLAASRTAIIGTLLGGLFFLYIVNKRGFFYFLKKTIYVAVLLILSYPFWKPYTERLNDKNRGSMLAGGVTSSRDVHWETRLHEFESSPFFGIGFSSVDVQGKGATFDSKTGQVETGSSWLSILSMTGLIGMITFSCVFVKAIVKALNFRKKDRVYAAYLLSLIVFWFFHMMAEGYILGAGSFLFLNIWLLLGYIYALDVNDKLKNEFV